MKQLRKILSLLGSIVIDPFVYLFSRLRIVMMVVVALVEVAIDELSAIKEKLISSMFWGRGTRYRYFTQISLLAVVLFMIFIASYNTPITTQVFSYSDYVGTTAVEQRDLLVESGDIETLIPEGRLNIEMKEYLVQPGDSLSSIAKMFSTEDNPISVEAIRWANDMTSVNQVRAGTKIKIPPGNGIMHTVVAGDTIESVAKKYSAASQAILDVNWIDKSMTLRVGQQVFVPDGKMPEIPKPTNPGGGGGSDIKRPLPPADPNVGRFLSWPVAGSAILTQCYSWYHPAIDLANRDAPDIVAAASGTVIHSGWQKSYGWSVQIDHGNGYTTQYGHMAELYVVSGQAVSKGTAIGKMGSTGRSTGTHLHFELRKGLEYSDAINALNYVDWSLACN